MIEVTLVGNWALVVLTGDFDVSNAGEIASVASDLAAQMVAEVTVDLGQIVAIDAAGGRALVAADRLITSAGGRLMLVGASPRLQEILEAAGLSAVLPLTPEPDRGPPPAVESGSEAAGDPVGDEELGRLLATVSQLLLTERTVTGDLQTIVRAAVDLVPGCTSASIALLVMGEPHTAAVSGPIAVEVDLAQYRTGEGPCLLAASTSTRIRVAVLEGDGRFGRFATTVGPLGIGAILSVPVTTGDATIGSLNLYSTTGFATGADAAGDVIAAQVAAALVKSDIYGAALALARRVRDRTDADRPVNIAAGILAGFEQCSLDQAVHLLRSAAVGTGNSLAVAAKQVIDQLSERGPVLS